MANTGGPREPPRQLKGTAAAHGHTAVWGGPRDCPVGSTHTQELLQGHPCLRAGNQRSVPGLSVGDFRMAPHKGRGGETDLGGQGISRLISGWQTEEVMGSR